MFAFIFPCYLVAKKIINENFFLFVCCLYDVIMLTHMLVWLESNDFFLFGYYYIVFLKIFDLKSV